MASENETVADIVREMRNDAIAADAWHETYGEMASAASTLNRHADRVEAAHGREVAELQRRLKVAEDALKNLLEIVCNVSEYIGVDCGTMNKVEDAKNALAAIRQEGGAR